ncbi:putative harbinger transposase-derived protein [Helianthus annuus]|nr:putative harbinger transposase-derived protein [Helianthus annuus]
MASNPWWPSSSDDEEEMFFANAVLRAGQILIEEEEEDEEEEEEIGENVITTRIRINRDRQAHEKLVNDYFSDEPLYNADIFRRRFRMSRRLFTRIANDLAGLDPFFTQRPDARNYEGFTTLQKCTAAIRQLAYGTVADALDEYLQMSARTTRECLYRFCHNVVKLYSKKYLRKPNAYDVQQLYQAHEARHGFPGMLGSIDCMHWGWHNCPTAWRGQYTRGDHGYPTVILEAVASQDLWIWHSFFGLPGSLNDLNVLYQSAIFTDVVNGTGPDTSFTVSGVEYRRGYYLADGIYPSWSTIVKTIPYPEDEKRKKFAKRQEAARKDIERAFGVLRKKWAIVAQRARAFTPKRLRLCMYACILLHNMIIEDEGRAICEYDENASWGNTVPVDPQQQDLNSFSLTNDFTHANLQQDLVEHIWNNVNIVEGDGAEDEDEDE